MGRKRPALGKAGGWTERREIHLAEERERTLQSRGGGG